MVNVKAHSRELHNSQLSYPVDKEAILSNFLSHMNKIPSESGDYDEHFLTGWIDRKFKTVTKTEYDEIYRYLKNEAENVGIFIE